jgi:hypothetical protein
MFYTDNRAAFQLKIYMMLKPNMASNTDNMCSSTVQWLPLDEAYRRSELSTRITLFDPTRITQYFIDTRADHRSIRDSSFQMFDRGYVQVK